MNVSPCSTASHSICWEGTWKLKFCIKCEICCWQKRHIVDHYGLIYAIRSSYNQIYTYEEGYETLHQQYIPLLVAQQHISCAERVLKISNLHEIWCLLLAEMTYCVPHKIPIKATGSSFDHPNAFKEWHEIVKQQWMSLLVGQHHIPFAERVPENYNFAWNVRIVVDRNDIL